MNKVFLDLLCAPKTHQSLTSQDGFLVSQDGKRFPIEHDIPVFITPEDVVGLNLKYQKMYDRIAKGYDWVIKIYMLFHRDGNDKRKELLKDLKIEPGMRVLETSIGTGFNLRFFTKQAQYFGIDISRGMLDVCQRENKKKQYDLHIAQANAEELPFKDNTFDVVFHVGGINFFNDIPKAINEMIRVAKPGAQILISDETQKHIDSSYKKIPFVRRFFKDAAPIAVPLESVPQAMKDITLRYVDNDSMYVITFFKP